jgi:hypothetical protein
MATQSRQKNYADPKRQSVKFQVDDKTLPRVSPTKVVVRIYYEREA